MAPTASPTIVSRPAAVLPSRSPRVRAVLLVVLALATTAGVYLGTRHTMRLFLFAVPAMAIVATMHVRIALGRWPAIGHALASAALVGLVGAGGRLVAVVLAGGILGAELVAPATRRSDVLQAGAWTGAGCALVGAAWSLAVGPGAPHGRLQAVDLMQLLAAGLITGPALLTLSAPLEWLFGHVTRLTLSEWLSYDHPLIRDLSLRAAGTFQHSTNVALLADAAARAIGADALLTRVGSLYHDVGKTRAPEYFIENQHGENPHDALSPAESAAILRAHVTDGTELVLDHRMGDRVADFVREHHGTGTMRSLLEKAVAAGDGGEVSEDAYRYPGPSPRSRESGILMIADQLEATARATPPADEAACVEMVRRTVERIEGDGQLRDAGFRRDDVALVSSAFVRVLLAMYHRRLTYPPAKTKPPSRRLAFIPRLVRGRSGS